ncbi:MAG: nitroreductase family protein [Firmicutes bacterium]|nr:nitroreductase family protein [Bacillota bacterium]
MEFLECLKGRRSIRKFKDTKIDHEVFKRIVENASYSPSWKNSQTARYIVVEDRVLLDKIANDCLNGFTFNEKTIKQAPALVLVTYVTGRCGYEKDGSFSTSKGDRWEMFDAGIASQTFSLSAYYEGLGCVILGVFNEELVSEAVGIPKDQKLAAMIAIGYPDIKPDMREHKTVEELISFK